MALKVIDALRELGVEGLAAGLEHRRDLLAAPPGTLDQLASRVCAPHSVFEALDGVDQWTYQVAELLALLPDEVTAADAAAAVGAPVTPADVERALEALRQRLLVFGVGACLRANPGLRQVFAKPFLLGDPARTLLAPRPPAEVAAIAGRLGLGAPATVDEIAEALADRATVLSVLAGTTPNALGVIDGPSPLVGLPPLGGWDHAARARSLEGPLQWLIGHGLLIVTGWATAEVPREVGLALRGGRPLPDPRPHPPDVASVPAATVEQVDAAAAEQIAATLQDMARLLAVLGDTPAEPLKDAGLGAREVKRLAKAVNLDTERTALLLELALAAALVPIATRPVAPTAAADEWLAGPPARRWIDLVASWWDTPGLPSLALRKELTDDAKPAPALLPRRVPGERERRHALLACLAELPEGHASRTLGSVVESVTWRAPRTNLGDLTDEITRLALGEAMVLGLTGAGALSSVGRALVAGDMDEAHTRAAALLRPPPPEVILQADLTAVVDARVDHDLLSELRLLADTESSGAALVLRFSPASIRRALDTGRSAADIAAFLEAHAPRGVPQPLAYLIDDTARRWGRLRSGAATSYLRCDDPVLLAEAVRHRAVAALGLRLLAPTVAVSDVQRERVLGALRSAGYLPAAEDAEGAVIIERPGRQRTPAGFPSVSALQARNGADPAQLARRLLSAPTIPQPSLSPLGRFDDEIVPDHCPTSWADDRVEVDLDELMDDILVLLEDASMDGAVVEVVTIDERGRPLALTGQVLTVSDDLVVLHTEPRGDLHEILLEDAMLASRREVNPR